MPVVHAHRAISQIRSQSVLHARLDGLRPRRLVRLRDLLHLLPRLRWQLIEVLDAILDDRPRRDQHRALPLHQRDGLVVEVAAMLDRLDASMQRVHDSRLAMAVSGDKAIGARCLVDDGLDLGRRELRVQRVVDEAQHAARRADLDDFGAAPDLQPHGAHALVHAVGHVHRDAFDALGAHQLPRVRVQVAVARRHADDRVRRVDVRSWDPAFVDGLRNEYSVAGHFADRCETGVQRFGEISSDARARESLWERGDDLKGSAICSYVVYWNNSAGGNQMSV